MNIIELTEHIENVVLKSDLVKTASVLKNEYAIPKSTDLQKAINEKKDEGRVLKIGILGRVKAGKSSLLNALVFDGQDVLPKAATPMTAALTVLQYGEETKANVEFFTQEDIDDIKQDAIRYENKLKNVKSIEYDKLLKLKQKKSDFKHTKEDEEELQRKALDIAVRELKKDDKLSSSHEQYQKIKSASVSVEKLSELQSITADNLTELNKQLLDFVGANGKYMPFTKSVTLTIKQESLKDIQIIDTPGVNDPVSSREERTKELLKYCDVVLMVSPAGQFLSSEDLDLMDRITSKEGIKEVYLVASQVDNQLYGSEKESGNGVLNKVLDVIEMKLTNQQREVFEQLKSQYPEISNTFDKLIENRVVASSGICYSMMKGFENQNLWDDNMQKVWENLNLHYKDFFDDKDTAILSLKKLANIELIKKIIDEVRSKKNAILAKSKEDFIKVKQKALFDYKSALEDDIKAQISRVMNTDIGDIKQKKVSIEQVKGRATDSANEVYFDLVEQLELDIKDKLNNKLNGFFTKSKEDINSSEGTESESWTTKEGGFFGFFKDTVSHSRTFTTVKAGFIRISLEDLTNKLESNVFDEAKKHMVNWRKTVYSELVGTLRKEAGDDMLDIMLISKTMRSILSSVNYPEISYENKFPQALKKSGTLKEREAEEFIEEVNNYISSLKSSVKRDIKDYVNSLVATLKIKNIGESIFSKYAKEIEQLQSDIENKELSLSRLNYVLKQLENIHA
ncbi:MAG: dynamin family protein [Campylobacterales bacterium]|nr:dynamin family protein [Campylobacterales bacterium]